MARIVPSPVAFRRDSGRTETKRPCRRVEGLAVDLEGCVPVEHDVELFLARPGLGVLADQRAFVAGPVRVRAERVDPEVLAHRDVPAARLDLVEARDLVLRLLVHTTHLRVAAGYRAARAIRNRANAVQVVASWIQLIAK
jgi:hypothetical protein